MCGLVPIGKKDYRGPLCPDKLICLEEEKEASLMTPNFKRLGQIETRDMHPLKR